jgi:hypothetical protein
MAKTIAQNTCKGQGRYDPVINLAGMFTRSWRQNFFDVLCCKVLMHGAGCEVFAGVSDTPSCSAPWVDNIIDDPQAGDIIPPFLNLPGPMLGVQPLKVVAPNPSMFDNLLRHKGFTATAKPHSFKPPRPI